LGKPFNFLGMGQKPQGKLKHPGGGFPLGAINSFTRKCPPGNFKGPGRRKPRLHTNTSSGAGETGPPLLSDNTSSGRGHHTRGCVLTAYI